MLGAALPRLPSIGSAAFSGREAMQAYVLLMTAAAWHAIGIGTVGLRGRIVAALCGVGFLWGALTPPWGWVQIGCAVGTVTGLRWAATERGREALTSAGWSLVGWSADTLRACWWAVVAVLSPPRTHEPVVIEHAAPVPPPGETAQVALPHGDRWGLLGPVAERADTAAVPALAPLETYAGVVADAAAGRRPFNETARYVKERYGRSRSTFARDVRATREGIAA